MFMPFQNQSSSLLTPPPAPSQTMSQTETANVLSVGTEVSTPVWKLRTAQTQSNDIMGWGSSQKNFEPTREAKPPQCSATGVDTGQVGVGEI